MSAVASAITSALKAREAGIRRPYAADVNGGSLRTRPSEMRIAGGLGKELHGNYAWAMLPYSESQLRDMSAKFNWGTGVHALRTRLL